MHVPPPRAGQLSCLCLDVDVSHPLPPRSFALTAAGFSLAVLAQILAVSFLPLAGSILAPFPALANLPFTAMLVGAAVATLPACLLNPSQARKAALSLGATLGIAGGVLAAWALTEKNFILLVLSAFWLGIAQGFGYFFRHGPLWTISHTRSAILIFGSATLAALLAPALVGWVESLSSPYLFTGTALATACIHVLALAVAVLLPPPFQIDPDQAVREAPLPLRHVLIPTLCAATAWFFMSFLMANAPAALALCGVSFQATSGMIAWHLIAMYASGPLLVLIINPPTAKKLTLIGMALTLCAMAVTWDLSSLNLSIALTGVAIGWSLTTLSASLWMYQQGWVSPKALALHDVLLFLSASAGSLIRIY